MNKKFKIILRIAVIFVTLLAIAATAWFVAGHNISVLNPKGTIADQQRNLIILATVLMSLVIIPVFALTFGIAWRYREGNKKAKYSPHLEGNKWAEIIWWIIPLIIISVLAVVVVISSRQLDPFKKISSNQPALKVQVISLQWKWLFIYPEQHIATINYLPIPTGRPIDFSLTSDAPMNSFWIPQLGGQIYTMSGMSTKLSLMATQTGVYRGQSANISGQGFASMKFNTEALTEGGFQDWVLSSLSAEPLTTDKYQAIAQPSSNARPKVFSLPSSSDDLYDTVVMKYMNHGKMEY